MVRKKVWVHICRVFVVIVLLAAAVAAIPSALPLGTAVTPDHILLTWTGDPRTTQTISWRTAVTTIAGQAQYAETAGPDGMPLNAKVAVAEVLQLSTNLGDMSLHCVTLTGLKPGTRYLYRVGDGTEWSETMAFRTAAATVPGFKFLVFGDSQSSNYAVWGDTLRQAYQANTDAAFMINTGDLVDVGQDYEQWNAWFDAAQNVIETIPVMPVTGNHEMYTPHRHFSLPEYFKAQFRLPDNGPPGLQGQAYSFDYGDVHFVMLDSQAGEEHELIPDMLERQQFWLEQDLSRTDRKWKVAVFHRPPYDNKPNRANENIRAAFVPIFDQYHVDVVFSGHDHVYARTYPLHGGTVADSPAHGTVYVTSGRSGTKTYKDMVNHDWDEFFRNPLDEPMYLVVEVQGDRLMVTAYQQSGGLIDSWSISKPAANRLAG